MRRSVGHGVPSDGGAAEKDESAAGRAGGVLLRDTGQAAVGRGGLRPGGQPGGARRRPGPDRRQLQTGGKRAGPVTPAKNGRRRLTSRYSAPNLSCVSSINSVSREELKNTYDQNPDQAQGREAVMEEISQPSINDGTNAAPETAASPEATAATQPSAEPEQPSSTQNSAMAALNAASEPSPSSSSQEPSASSTPSGPPPDDFGRLCCIIPPGVETPGFSPVVFRPAFRPREVRDGIYASERSEITSLCGTEAPCFSRGEEVPPRLSEDEMFKPID